MNEMAQTEVQSPFATIEEAIEDIRSGRFVVVVDDADRENEGDLTIAAQFATPEAINFMATHARGLICLCLTEERCDELGLRMMSDHNETPFNTAFTSPSRRAKACRRASPRTTGRTRSRWRSTPARARATSSSPATSSRCARATAACSFVRGRRRRPSISRASPA
jgi:3,4-dihydroxy-2-butanone 4-phosphate synthase